jgi:hypothetical protein
MLKRFGLPVVALLGMFVLFSAAPANAQTRFGVFVGGPAPVYQYAPPVYPAYPYYPYAGSYYGAPGYPYYAAPYYGYGFGYGFGFHDGFRRDFDHRDFRGGFGHGHENFHGGGGGHRR